MNRPHATTNEYPEGGRNHQPRLPQDDALDLAVTDVVCEAEGLAAGGRVFFVAGDDDSAADEGPAIDFNVLAETGEDVAEVVGEVAAKRPVAKPLAQEPLPEEIPEDKDIPEEEPLAQAIIEAIAEPEPEAIAVIEPEAEPAAAAVESASGEYLPASPAAAAAAVPEVAAAPASPLASPPASPPETPRQQRSRERARRKKERRAAKAAKAAATARSNELPEIILARSEGTDTLLPESNGAISLSTEIPGLDAATLEATLLGPAELDCAALPASPDPEQSPAQACARGPVRSLITPIDIIEENSDIISDAVGEKEAPELEAAQAAAELGELAEDAVDAVDAVDDRALLLSAESDELRLDAYDLLDDAGAEEAAQAAQAAQTEDARPEDADAAMNNVILFRPMFLAPEDASDSLDSPDSLDAEDEADSAFAPPLLRLLPPAEENADEEGVAAGSTASEAAAVLPLPIPEQGLSQFEKLTLLRAIAGGAEADIDAGSDSGSDSSSVAGEAAENVILFRALYSESIDPQAELERARTELAAELSAEITAELTVEMERTLQARADEFALRLLEAQAAAVESEGRARTSEAALLDNEKIAAELRAEMAKDTAGFNEEKTRMAEELRASQERLAASGAQLADRDSRLRRFDGLQDEHEKLYAQFEDLRTAYNEIVTSAMPGLQAERDDFALTVERQVDEMSSLKSSLSGARRRLAVGYSMAAAACIMIVSLPIAGWLESGADARAAARDRQEVAELRDRADEAERQTLAAGETIIELERKLNLAAGELAKLESRDGELSRRGREIAASASSTLPGGGTPTRASTMALQATPAPGGGLRVNEVRDPAGSIEQVYADNRIRRERADGPQMAAASAPSGRIAVSAVARAKPAAKPAGKPAAASASLRPSSDRDAVADRTAAVRSGEGVAQVVYRVMGTRDPEVINWVIRENGIKLDRRGNPRIYPEQQLRLPGRMEQTASR